MEEYGENFPFHGIRCCAFGYDGGCPAAAAEDAAQDRAPQPSVQSPEDPRAVRTSSISPSRGTTGGAVPGEPRDLVPPGGKHEDEDQTAPKAIPRAQIRMAAAKRGLWGAGAGELELRQDRLVNQSVGNPPFESTFAAPPRSHPSRQYEHQYDEN
jgi:hypothetical protein